MAAVVERMSLIDLRNSRHVQPNGKEEVAKWMHLQPGTVLYLSADVRTEAVTHFTLRKTVRSPQPLTLPTFSRLTVCLSLCRLIYRRYPVRVLASAFTRRWPDSSQSDGTNVSR